MRNLFVYGTLHPDRAPAELRAIVAQLEFAGNASVQGKVLELEGYPGLVESDEAGDRVNGSLFRLPDDAELLAALDDYEGVRPENPARGLFRREERMATLEQGEQRSCWVYLYNGECDTAQG